MARALIVGCGCRGRALGRILLADGWQVRGTSRTDQGLAAIEAEGLEAVHGDPDRVGSLVELLADVTVVVWALGCAAGELDAAAAVNGPRLERMLERVVDTPVRAFIYDGAGSAPAESLAAGAALVHAAAERWRIPVAFVMAAPGDWGAAAAAAIARALKPG